MIKIIKKASSVLTPRERQNLVKISIFSFFYSLSEIIGIIALMPFLQIALDFNKIHENEYMENIYLFFHFQSEKDFVVWSGVALLFLYVIKAAVGYVYYKYITRFVRNINKNISLKLFQNFIGFSYQNFIQRNSSNLIKSIITESQGLSALFQNIVLLVSNAIMMISIYGMLLVINFKMTILITVFLLISGLVLNNTITKKIKAAGKLRAEKQKIYMETLTSSLKNFKLIKLHSKEDSVKKKFNDQGNSLFSKIIFAETYMQLPKIILETIGVFIIVSIILYWIFKYQTDIRAQMGVLSVFVMALYKLLPSFNRVLTSYNQISFLEKSADIILEDLSYKKEEIGDEEISLPITHIEASNLRFSYDNKSDIFSNISLEINKNDRIAFVGKSGGGKSTLVDVLSGLLEQTDGYLSINGVALSPNNIKSYRKKIGYISQEVFVFPGTVYENISFDDKTDKKKADKLLKEVDLYDTFQPMDGGETLVGEGFVNLSGGQKQRLSVARALYRDPDVLILDEATSALDNQTEAKIMKKVYESTKDKILIIIAHRLTTVKDCNKFYIMENGKLIQRNTYDEMLSVIEQEDIF